MRCDALDQLFNPSISRRRFATARDLNLTVETAQLQYIRDSRYDPCARAVQCGQPLISTHDQHKSPDYQTAQPGLQGLKEPLSAR